MVWHNGNMYEGGWKDGKRDGEGMTTSADGTTQRGEWKDGILQSTQELDDSVEIVGTLTATDIVAQNVKAAEANGEVIEIL